MRKVIFRVVLVCAFSVFSIFSLNGNDFPSNQTIIVQIDNLSEEQNVQIFRYFMNHTDLKVINTCQELGLVVFQYKGDDDIAEHGISHLVSSLLKEKFNIEEVNWLQDYAQNDVNINCRAKKRELLGQ